VLVWLGPEADASDMVMSVLHYMDVYAQRYSAAERMAGFWFRKFLGDKSRVASYTEKLEQHESKMIENYKLDHNIAMAFFTILEGLDRIREADDELNREQDVGELYQEEASRGRLPARREQFWMAYYKLMTRPWFYRVWTYQEILLAKRAVVLCGEDLVDWPIVAACRHCLSLYALADVLHLSKTQGLDPILSVNLGGEIQRYQNAKPPVGARDEACDLFKLLIDMNGRQASRNKDYVYGLLGLVDERTRRQIPVDYQRSDAEVYTNAMANCYSSLSTEVFGMFWLLMTETYLDTAIHRMENLPSWCPDFSSSSGGIKEFTKSEHYVRGTAVSARVSKHWKVEQAELSEDAKRLTMSALLLDIVQHVSTLAAGPYTLKLVDGTNSECITWLEFDRLRDHFCAWLETRKQLLNSCALSHDILCDLMWPPDIVQPATARKSMQASELASVEQLCSVTRAMNLRTWEEAAKAVEHHGIDADRVYRLYQYMAQALQAHLGRYHFVTREGSVGHSAKPLKQGDLLCYFPRGFLLHAVRNEGRFFRYISIASVDGTGGDGLVKLFNTPEKWFEVTMI